MYVLTIPTDDQSRFDLVLIFEDSGIERLKRHDPAEYVEEGMPKFLHAKIRNVLITYAAPGEITYVMELINKGDPIGAVNYLTRGFEVKTEDHGRIKQLAKFRPKLN